MALFPKKKSSHQNLSFFSSSHGSDHLSRSLEPRSASFFVFHLLIIPRLSLSFSISLEAISTEPNLNPNSIYFAQIDDLRQQFLQCEKDKEVIQLKLGAYEEENQTFWGVTRVICQSQYEINHKRKHIPNQLGQLIPK